MNDEVIVTIVRRLERNLAVRGTGKGVLPRHVQPWLDEDRCEMTVRRWMRSLSEKGLLERVGGEKCRRGYVVYRFPPGRTFPRQLELPGF